MTTHRRLIIGMFALMALIPFTSLLGDDKSKAPIAPPSSKKKATKKFKGKASPPVKPKTDGTWKCTIILTVTPAGETSSFPDPHHCTDPDKDMATMCVESAAAIAALGWENEGADVVIGPTTCKQQNRGNEKLASGKAAAKMVIQPQLVCFQYCTSRDGTALYRQAKGVDAEAIAATAWNLLRAAAASKGGVNPRTTRTRIERSVYYLHYHRVTAHKGNTIHSFDVEGRGDIAPRAQSASASAGAQSQETLEHQKFTNVEVSDLQRLLPVPKMPKESWHLETKHVRVRCKTKAGKVIFATGIDISDARALARAKQIAHNLAQDHGGVDGECTRVKP